MRSIVAVQIGILAGFALLIGLALAFDKFSVDLLPAVIAGVLGSMTTLEAAKRRPGACCARKAKAD